MSKKRTIVEINGRQYDTVTGKIISNTPNATPVIDGFRAPTKAVKKAAQPRTVNAANSIHKKPQKTQKLHPAAVKKQITPKKIMSKATPAKRESAVTEVHKPVMLGQRSARAKRATLHSKSEQVTRFTPQAIKSKAAPIVEAQPAPAVEPMRQPEVVTRPEAQAQPEPPQQAEAQLQEKKQGFISKISQKRPRLVPATITTALFLAAFGYVAYKNIPNMALRVAAQRAGFDASLPGYSPSGFGFAGPVSYSEGIVELEYRSNSDDRTYRLIQRESSWDSQTLLDNYVSSVSKNHLTFQERGLTVYIYNDSNATWVDGGVWYRVEGSSLLTSEQLLKIAGSI